MKKGFTIVELLVASLLLSMLVSILTMMFNQSSIAWRTGTSGVVDMNVTRVSLATVQDIGDDALPHLGEQNPSPDQGNIQYRTVSIWDKYKDNELRTPAQRAFNKTESINWGEAQQFSVSEAKTGAKKDIRRGQRIQAASPYSVGVRSLGPDGKPDTEDDITTWPELID